jgi:hypothetical protein
MDYTLYELSLSGAIDTYLCKIGDPLCSLLTRLSFVMSINGIDIHELICHEVRD